VKAFLEKTHFRENAYIFLENCRPLSSEKTLHPGSHLALITPVSQRQPAQMVGESWNVFKKKKLVLVEKHINDIMCENPRPLPLALLFRRPWFYTRRIVSSYIYSIGFLSVAF